MKVVRKPLWEARKHQAVMAGTGFEKCAEKCGGCGGKLNERGEMLCSATWDNIPVWVTVPQALACKGKHPLPPPSPRSRKKGNSRKKEGKLWRGAKYQAPAPVQPSSEA